MQVMQEEIIGALSFVRSALWSICGGISAAGSVIGAGNIFGISYVFGCVRVAYFDSYRFIDDAFA